MKVSRKESIARKLKQWARLAQRQKQIESERDLKLQPLKNAFEDSCAPIVAAADAKLSVLQAELATLATQIENDLKAGAKPDGTAELFQVEIDKAVATLNLKPTREISAQKFFKSFPASQRNAAFWSCLKVLLGESTKLIGAQRVEQLAEKTYSPTVQISLK